MREMSEIGDDSIFDARACTRVRCQRHGAYSKYTIAVDLNLLW